jgi:hypothetical protein
MEDTLITYKHSGCISSLNLANTETPSKIKSDELFSRYHYCGEEEAIVF